MSDDVLITPGSRKIEFKDSSANVDAKIETDSSGNLIITNTGGDITIGDTTSDIFVGDGTANVDIVFEQAGEIRGTTGVTVTLGASDSNIRMATDLNLNSNNITNVNDLTITGNLNITGDINSYNVTDLDVTDKTITVGAGQTEANSGGSGLIVDGSGASLLWDESDNYWAMNKKLAFDDTATTTDQALGIKWTGFDKEGTTDFSDTAEIVHTTNTGGHAGSVLLIKSQNDSGDGIAFSTNASSYLKHNSSNILTAANAFGQLGITSTAAELNKLDGYTGSVTELNYLDTLHATGVTSTEFDYLDGVTSNIQTQLNSKQASGSYLTSSSGLNASNLTSGTLNTARLPNPIHLSGGNAILKLQETDVTNNPTWWHVADGGTYSIRLNNTGNYPISISTDSDNDLVTLINLGYGVSITGDLTASGNGFFNGTKLESDSKEMIRFSDSWLRINPANEFTSGIYAGTGILRTDGTFQVGASGSAFSVTSAGNVSLSGTLDGRDIAADGSKLDGIEAGATADQTASEILTAIKTVDGTGSGLDADKVDGVEANRIIFGSNTSGTNEGTVTNWNSPTKTGFYSDDAASNKWSTANWSSIMHIKLYDNNNNYASQLGFDTYNPDLYYRMNNNGTWTSWYEIYHEGHKPTYSELGTMAYSNLTGTPTIPTNNNQLTNGASYITSSALSGYATESYVTTQVNNLIDSAPGALNTLNELAAAINDDASFSTTVTNSIATKLPLAGGTMTGDINMNANDVLGASKITLNMNPVGTSYGGTSSATPANMISQVVGSNDGWRLYGEGASNDVQMIFEIIDDLETGDTWIFRNKKTYSDYSTRNEFIITGEGTFKSRGNGYVNTSQRVFADDYHPNADKWTTARTLSLTGAVTGSVSWDGSGNASITTTATSDPTLTLSGDASGSATFTNLGNATLSVTVNDDSHNHIISNVDGLQTALDGKLSTTGTAANSQLLDSIDSTGFLRSDANDTLSSTLKVTGSIIHEYNSAGGYIARPKGAQMVQGSSSHTGAIKIKLPTHGTADMLSFWVDIFDYTAGESVSLWIAGYLYQTTGNNEWVNETALIFTENTGKAPENVRFGADGSNNCVWIGETTDTWSYPQIIVRDFQAGFSTDIDAYDDNWDISFVTSFDTVDTTRAAKGPVTEWDRVEGKPTIPTNNNQLTNGAGYITGNQTITLSGDVSGSGTTSISVTVADDSHNHVISNVDGLQTALDAKLTSSSGLNASNLTSGTVPDARIAASSITQHTDSKYLRSNATDTASGALTFSGDTTFTGNIGNSTTTVDSVKIGISAGGDPQIQLTGDGVNPHIDFSNASGQDYDVRIINNATNQLDFQGIAGTGLKSAGNTIWHAGNDGSGSGLDADTVDGVHISNATMADGAVMYATSSTSMSGASSQKFARGTYGQHTEYSVGGPGGSASSTGYIGDNYPILGGNSDDFVISGGADVVIGQGGYARLRFDGSYAHFFQSPKLGASLVDNGNVTRINSSGNMFPNQLTVGSSPSKNMNYASSTLTVGSVDDDDFYLNLKGFGGNSNIYMDDGDIWVNGTSNSTAAYKFASNGHFHSNGDVIAYSSTLTASDRRLKENVQALENPLEKVMHLQGVRYDWKDKNRGTNQIGLIAQEVEEIIPEVVNTIQDSLGELSDMKVVNYSALVPVLIEAIKQQQEEIEKLKELAHPKCGLETFEGYEELVNRIKKLEEK